MIVFEEEFFFILILLKSILDMGIASERKMNFTCAEKGLRTLKVQSI